jgi:hypothetical protein
MYRMFDMKTMEVKRKPKPKSDTGGKLQKGKDSKL